MQRLITTNWLAIVASIVVHFILGMAWYGSLGGPWMASIGKSMDQLNATVPQTVYVLPLFTATAILLGTALVMDLAGERTIAGGVKWAAVLWLCFQLPYGLLHNAFGGFDPTLTVIDAGYELAGALLNGVILGVLGFRGRAVARQASAPAAAAA
jgi:hypothetical protein